MGTTRRDFLKAGLAAGVATAVPAAARAGAPGLRRRRVGPPAQGPVAVASANGQAAVGRALEVLGAGGDALDAVIEGVGIVEADPDDLTVGYGGLPNALGVVQLDACCMHGPTHRAGAVAALEGFRHPSRVARLVMEETDHVLLVGEGARRFALEHGFEEEDLLTDTAREIWLYWRAVQSDIDDYLPPDLDRFTPRAREIIERNPDLFYPEQPRPTGTINCCAVDAAGDVSGVTTTSGLFFKIPGRVGDSPIVGAGLYVDNDVGAAGSTGRGEANLLNLSSFLVVEEMRHGLSPSEACLAGCRRIAENTLEERLRRPDGRPDFNVSFYAVNVAGEYGSASIYGPGRFAVAGGGRPARLEDRASLFPADR